MKIRKIKAAVMLKVKLGGITLTTDSLKLDFSTATTKIIRYWSNNLKLKWLPTWSAKASERGGEIKMFSDMQAPEWAPQQTTEKALENVPQRRERPRRGPRHGKRPLTQKRGEHSQGEGAGAKTSTLTRSGWPRTGTTGEVTGLGVRKLLTEWKVWEHESEVHRKPNKWKIRQLLTPGKKKRLYNEEQLNFTIPPNMVQKWPEQTDKDSGHRFNQNCEFSG